MVCSLGAEGVGAIGRVESCKYAAGDWLTTCHVSTYLFLSSKIQLFRSVYFWVWWALLILDVCLCVRLRRRRRGVEIASMVMLKNSCCLWFDVLALGQGGYHRRLASCCDFSFERKYYAWEFLHRGLGATEVVLPVQVDDSCRLHANLKDCCCYIVHNKW